MTASSTHPAGRKSHCAQHTDKRRSTQSSWLLAGSAVQAAHDLDPQDAKGPAGGGGMKSTHPQRQRGSDEGGPWRPIAAWSCIEGQWLQAQEP